MRSLLIAALATCSIAVSSADAANITVHAEGVLSEFFDPEGLLPFEQPAPGTVFRLSLSYDSEAPDLFSPGENDTFPNLGLYSSITSFRLEVGEDVFGLLNRSNIFVFDDFLALDLNPSNEYLDGWQAATSNESPTGRPDERMVEFIFLDLSTRSMTTPISTLDSDELIVPFGPSPWETAEIAYTIDIRNIQGGTPVLLAEARATVTSLTVIPIPAAVWLFSSALGLLGWTNK